MLAVVTPLVIGRQCSTVVAELSSTTDARSLPRPYAVTIRQGLADRVSVAVEKIRLKLPGGRVKSNDFESPDGHRSDAAVCGMHHEMAAWRPLVDIACDDRGGRRAILCNRLALSKPTADEHIQPF